MKDSQNQAGGSSAPLRRSSRAAVTSQAVSSAVSQLAAATKSFRRLVNFMGTPRDTSDLRENIRTKGAQIEHLIKDILYNLSKFMEPDHYDTHSPTRELTDGELAKKFGEIIGDFQEVKKLLVEREAVPVPSLTEAGEAGVLQSLRNKMIPKHTSKPAQKAILTS